MVAATTPTRRMTTCAGPIGVDEFDALSIWTLARMGKILIQPQHWVRMKAVLGRVGRPENHVLVRIGDHQPLHTFQPCVVTPLVGGGGVTTHSQNECDGVVRPTWGNF